MTTHSADDSSAARWSGKALFAVVVWGASFVATRMALETFTPYGLTATRLVVSGAAMLALARFSGRAIVPRGDRRVCVVLGAIGAVHLFIQAHGLMHTSAVRTGWIIGFIPVTIALGARVFLKQRLSSAAWLGVAIATGGITLIMLQQVREFVNASFGDMLQLSSCLTWTAHTLISAGPVRRNGPLTVTAFVTALSAVLMAPMAIFGGPLLAGAVTPRAVGALLFLGVICGGVAYYCWYAALTEHGAARTGSYLYLEPFVTWAVARRALQETVSVRTILGGCLILLGVYTIARARQRLAERAGED
ncbi:MAG: DMT family transporter [Phycisphaerales bacterium]|nr:MAG: DMT family transporter [Phycisphaerales bacterium]